MKLRNLFKKSVVSIEQISEETRDGINKAYIPKFLYKPPFGFPRYANLPYIRWLATTPYVEMCISTIIDELCSIKWDITVKEEKKDKYLDENGDLNEAKRKEIETVKNFFLNPNTNKESFEETFIKMPVRDVLEVNAGVLNKVYNLKGELVEIVARDGATFTKNPDIHGMMTYRNDLILPTEIVESENEVVNPFQQIPQGDVRKQAAYFQYGWICGPVPVPFGKKEIIWLEKQKRTDEIYGYSPVQTLAKSLQMLMWMIESDLEYYNDNNVPKGIIGLDGSDAEEIEAFKEQWFQQQRKKDEFGNYKKIMNKVPIVNKIPEFKRIEFSASEMQLIEKQKWYTKLVWACYDNKTEILTEDGWKLFKDLKDEKVARVNPKNLNIDYVKPEKKQEYDFDGELYYYKHRNIDLAVTPDHKLLYKSIRDYEANKETDWNICQAKDEKSMVIPQAGHYEGNKIEKLIFKSEEKRCSRCCETQVFEIEGNDFVEFMGFWLGDGWIESASNKIVLCASDVYPENKEFIEKLLKRIGINYQVRVSKANTTVQGREVRVNGDMNYYQFSNRAFADYLRQFKKAHDKFIPKIIKDCNKEQRKLFFDAYMLADGSKGKKGRNSTYFSMSKRLIDDLQEMFVKEGIASNINEQSNGYNLTVRQSQFKEVQNTSFIEKKHVKKERYIGKVYDVTVPEHHFLIVRRNGRVSISGNCFGVTSTELGYTEDAQGQANQIVQSKVFKKKAINPMLRLLENKFNHEIVSEFGFEDIEFKFMTFDIDDERNKFELYKLQTESGVKTINEIRNEEGLEPLDWGDDAPRNWKQSDNTNSFMFGNNPFVDKEKEAIENRDINQSQKIPTPENPEIDKEKEKVDKKSFKEGKSVESKPGMGHSDKWWDMYHALVREGHTKESAAKITNSKIKGKSLNPLILEENEKPMSSERLENSIVYLLNQNEKVLKELLEKEIGKDKISGIKAESKAFENLISKIREVLTFAGLKRITDVIIRNNFYNGWEEAEKTLDKNFIVDENAINFIQDYTFENIKGMNDDLANNLRQELQRGFMNGEGINKLKSRVTGVFDASENRAEMIARTETIRAKNTGKLLGYKNSGAKGKKKWVTHFDNRTSELCKRLDGQEVGLNEDFKDPNGTWSGQNPPAHCNCRSTFVFIPE